MPKIEFVEGPEDFESTRDLLADQIIEEINSELAEQFRDDEDRINHVEIHASKRLDTLLDYLDRDTKAARKLGDIALADRLQQAAGIFDRLTAQETLIGVSILGNRLPRVRGALTAVDSHMLEYNISRSNGTGEIIDRGQESVFNLPNYLRYSSSSFYSIRNRTRNL